MSPSIELGDTENEQITSATSEDSGYGSIPEGLIQPEVVFTPSHLKFLNERLSVLEPEDILRWCLISLPGLYQTTALGLTGTSITMFPRFQS
jgi:phosphoadenosine phosphosulfate reductase